MRFVGRFGLRSRATAAFGAMGLGVSVSMALMTWFVARGYLVDQRETSAERQAYANARLIRSALRASDVDVATFLAGLGAPSGGSIPVVRHAGEWYTGSLALGREVLPGSLQEVVSSGGAGHQRFRDPEGELHLAVGVALPAVDASYFEVFPMDDLERSLSVLRGSLAAGAAVSSIAAAVVGRTAAGRVLRPLVPVTATAERIAAGDLGARLAVDEDRDLAPLSSAFNSMADSLQRRIAAEARFASDVSHELRSPLAVLSATTDVIERRRDQLPEVVSSAFDMLKVRLANFESLVLDLLEISRFDNGAAQLELGPVDIASFLHQLVASYAPTATVSVDPNLPRVVEADRRRLGQVLRNICDNARVYGGGVTTVQAARRDGDALVIDLDDCGPGVAPAERRTIFDRFARGEAGRRAGSATGSGLGLALAAEHVRLHGGQIEVLDSPCGGARFRVSIPLTAS